MRVCQVIDRLNGGGQERAAVEFAIGVAPRVTHSALLATRESGDYARLLAGSPVELFVSERTGRFDLTAWARTRAWLARSRFDVVHTHSPGSLLNMVMLRDLTGLGFRIVAHLQMLPAAGNRWYRQVVAWHTWTRSRVDATIVTNDGLRDFLVNQCNHRPERVEVVYNPVDFASITAPGVQRQSPGEPPIVAMVAQWRKQKDQPCAIRAAALLKARGVRAQWLLIGEEDPALTEPARVLVRDLGAEDVVKILGRRTDVKEILQRAAVGVLATHFEGLPVSVIEYCAAGLPCVVSDVVGTRQIVSPANGVLGVVEGDSNDLAAAVGRLLDDESGARVLGARARAYMMAKADRPVVMNQVLAIYRRALARRGSAGARTIAA